MLTDTARPLCRGSRGRGRGRGQARGRSAKEASPEEVELSSASDTDISDIDMELMNPDRAAAKPRTLATRQASADRAQEPQGQAIDASDWEDVPA